ncbi:MAG: MerR family transcriptional regulator [Bdellovibrionota bacterium]
MSMSIGQLAKQANVSNRTVRYYEELGLIVPKSRGSNRYRYYDDTHLSRLNLVKMLQDSGFALKEIVAALNPMLDPQGNITYSGQEMARSIHQSLQEHRERLIQKQRELIKSVAAIDSTLEELRECFTCSRGHDLTQCATCTTGPSGVVSLGRHLEQRTTHGEHHQ